jgi:penicillin-binding protein 2
MDYWRRHHAWFAGFAPAEAPELAVVVLNEHGGMGGTDAAPTAMALFKKYFELKQQDAVDGPPKRTNIPYEPNLPPAPRLEDVRTTRSIPVRVE